MNQYCYAFCEEIEASFCDELRSKIAENEHCERFMKRDYTYMQSIHHFNHSERLYNHSSDVTMKSSKSLFDD
jgi:hypothetical protein